MSTMGAKTLVAPCHNGMDWTRDSLKEHKPATKGFRVVDVSPNTWCPRNTGSLTEK